MKIGVLSHPREHGGSRYPTDYVHWVRMSGATAIIIPYDIPRHELYQRIQDVDGIVLTGGDIEMPKYTKTQYTNYVNSVKRCIRKAKEINDRGTCFPVWGTCLGFELLLLLEGVKDVHGLFDRLEMDEHYFPSTLHMSGSSILKSYFTSAEVQRFKRTRCVIHRHNFVFKGQDYPFVVEVAKEGEYMSMFEFKKYPFFGCQFHVENPFNPASTYISYKLSMFLKESCKN